HVVVEDVDPPEALARRRHQARDVVLARHVGGKGPRPAAVLGDEVHRLLRGGERAVDDAYVRALAAQHDSGGAAGAHRLSPGLAASHDDGGLALDARADHGSGLLRTGARNRGHGRPPRPLPSTAPPGPAQAYPGPARAHLRYTTAARPHAHLRGGPFDGHRLAAERDALRRSRP